LSKDLLLIDPEGDAEQRETHQHFRHILRHYSSFFEKQAQFDVSETLSRIAESPTVAFEAYLYDGDAELRSMLSRRRRQPFMTSFRIGENVFWGMAWHSWAIPGVLGVEDGDGVLVWGLWEPIIPCLADGRLQEISEAEFESWESLIDGVRYVVLDDGTAIVWAPNIDRLMRIP
jgi:hypothetical protein